MNRAPTVGMGCERSADRTNRIVGARFIAPFNRMVCIPSPADTPGTADGVRTRPGAVPFFVYEAPGGGVTG